MMALNGVTFGKAAMESIPKERLEELLSVAQLQVFNNLEKYAGGGMQGIQMAAMAGPDIEDANNEEDESVERKKICNEMMDLKMAELSELCDLKDSQIRMLNIARKGAIQKVDAWWTDKMKNAMAMMNGPAGPDIELISKLSQPFCNQVTAENTWKKAMSKVLTEGQLAKIEAREETRRVAGKKHVINYFTFSMFQQMGSVEMSFDEHIAMFEMLERNVDVRDGYDFYGAVFQMFKIPDEELKKS